MPELAFTWLTTPLHAERVLVVGPSLGTSVAALWSTCAALMPRSTAVLGWDLPGHGMSPPAEDSFTVEDLTDAVRRRAAQEDRPVDYAGVSLGGTLAFVLADEPGPFRKTAALASAPKIGDPLTWYERAEYVRRHGTEAVVDASRKRWFSTGFQEKSVVDNLIATLEAADDESYANACEALAVFDATGAIRKPNLIAAGEFDPVIPPGFGENHVFAGCGHLPPAEDPRAVAGVLS